MPFALRLAANASRLKSRDSLPRTFETHRPSSISSPEPGVITTSALTGAFTESGRGSSGKRRPLFTIRPIRAWLVDGASRVCALRYSLPTATATLFCDSATSPRPNSIAPRNDAALIAGEEETLNTPIVPRGHAPTALGSPPPSCQRIPE